MTRLTHLWNVPRALCMAYENGFFQAFKHKQLQFSYTTHFESYQLSCSTTLPSLALSPLLLARSTSTSYSPSSSHIQQEKYGRRRAGELEQPHRGVPFVRNFQLDKRLCFPRDFVLLWYWPQSVSFFGAGIPSERTGGGRRPRLLLRRS